MQNTIEKLKKGTWQKNETFQTVSHIHTLLIDVATVNCSLWDQETVTFITFLLELFVPNQPLSIQQFYNSAIEYKRTFSNMGTQERVSFINNVMIEIAKSTAHHSNSIQLIMIEKKIKLQEKIIQAYKISSSFSYEYVFKESLNVKDIEMMTFIFRHVFYSAQNSLFIQIIHQECKIQKIRIFVDMMCNWYCNTRNLLCLYVLFWVLIHPKILSEQIAPLKEEMANPIEKNDFFDEIINELNKIDQEVDVFLQRTKDRLLYLHHLVIRNSE